MTIPKKLELKRDELAAEYVHKIDRMYRDDCMYKTHGDEDFKAGFNSACNLLLPEIEKLEEAIKQGSFYLVFHSQGKGATEFYQMNEDAAKISKALQSLREFFGEAEK